MAEVAIPSVAKVDTGAADMAGAGAAFPDEDATVEVAAGSRTERETTQDLLRAMERELAIAFRTDPPCKVELTAAGERARARSEWRMAVRTLPSEVSELVATVDLPTLRMHALENIEKICSAGRNVRPIMVGSTRPLYVQHGAEFCWDPNGGQQ